MNLTQNFVSLIWLWTGQARSFQLVLTKRVMGGTSTEFVSPKGDISPLVDLLLTQGMQMFPGNLVFGRLTVDTLINLSLVL